MFKTVTTKPDIMYSIERYPNLYWLKDSVFVSDYSKLVAQETVSISTFIWDEFSSLDENKTFIFYYRKVSGMPISQKVKIESSNIIRIDTASSVNNDKTHYRCPNEFNYIIDTDNEEILNSKNLVYCYLVLDE